MKQSITVLVFILGFCCRVGPLPAADCHVSPEPIPWPKDLPRYDHVVIVVEENKGFSQIVGAPEAPAPEAPYINSLRTEGASLTQMFAEEHHSQGNYFWLLSGSNQSVGFRDGIPKKKLTASNLAQRLGDGAFKGYSEDLPTIGFPGKFAAQKLYARKHVPWISFSNIPNGETIDKSANLRFADFPRDEEGFSHLPRVSFVIPNQDHDMHNGKAPCSILAGDNWLRQNLDRYYQWARQNNSLLIVTFDENDHESFFGGLTDPAAQEPEDRNQIATIFAGAHVKRGFEERRKATHVNVLRTLEAMYDLPRSGAQQEKACAAGIYDDFILSDLWEKIDPL